MNKVRTFCKRMVALLLVTLTVASMNVSAMAAGQVLPNGCYLFYSSSKHTGMNVKYKAGNGGLVCIDTIDLEENEIWVVENVGFGPWVTIQPYHVRNQAIYLSGENGFDGDLVVRKGFPSDTRFHWKPIKVGENQYQLQNRATGYVVDCAYGHNEEIGNRYLTYSRSNFVEAQYLYAVRISELTGQLTPSIRINNLKTAFYTMHLDGNRDQVINIQYGAGFGGFAVCDPDTSELHEIVRIVDRGSGHYSIHFAHRMDLALTPADIFAGSRMTLKTYDGSRAFLWEVYRSGSGYAFRNAGTGLMLDDYCYQTRSGTPVIAYSFTGDHAGPQIFHLEEEKNVNVSGLVSPVPGGCYFNKKSNDWNMKSVYHDINIGVSKNTPVYAMAGGTVEYRQYYKWKNGQRKLTSYGNCIVLTSADKQWRIIYAHLDRYADSNVPLLIGNNVSSRESGGSYSVRKTAQVSQGQVLGYIGNTGNVVAGGGGDGTHLHIEIYRNGVRVDPTTVVAGLTR